MTSVKHEPRLLANPYDLGRLLREMRREPKEFRVQVRRPDDHLVFELAFDNLKLAGDTPPRLVREKEKSPATLIVWFPPQSFGEQAFLQVAQAVEDSLASEDTGDPAGKEVSKNLPADAKKNVQPTPAETVPPLPSAWVRMAGPSRLAFAMPAGEESLDYSLAAVLEAMRTWPLRLSISAQPDVAPPPGKLSWAPVDHTLGEIGVASRWEGVRHDLTGALEARGIGGIAQVIEEAAARVAESAAAALVGSGAEFAAPVVQQIFFAEFHRVEERFGQLRGGPDRRAAQAALALQSAEILTVDYARFQMPADILGQMALVPMLVEPHEPPRTVTSLELPYRLLLSPIESARFAHRDEVVERRGRTELWHTRMTTGDGSFGPDVPGKARAIWSPDMDEDVLGLLSPPNPFRMTLDPLDRQMLVKLMAGYNERYYLDEAKQNSVRFYPRASHVERLHLSALGGLLDAEGNWDPRPDLVDLEQWRHVMGLGRDSYVRVVYAGRLCPTGHACSLVKVTERKFEQLGSGPGRVAVLRQRFYLVVRERVRTYDGKRHKDFKGRNFPFTEVEILTRVTPDLLEPGEGESAVEKESGGEIYDADIVPRMVFWPMLPGPTKDVDFRFEIAATDLSGERITFSLPLLFVSEVANQKKPGPIRAAYNHADTKGRRQADLAGSIVTFAEVDPAAQGDPRLPTNGMTFAAGEVTFSALEPNFYPEVAEAKVGIPPLQKLLGQPGAVIDAAYPQVYKKEGFGAKNAGQVFLQVVAGSHQLEFGGEPGQPKSDALGSLATPHMAIQGLSRLIGPVGAAEPTDPNDPAQVEEALKKVIDGEFRPADFFADATILGGVKLADILEVATGLAGADTPKMVTRELTDRIESRFTWDTEVTETDPLKLFIPNADENPSKPTRLKMDGLTTTPVGSPQEASFRAAAKLDNFKVNLFGFVILWFEELRFDAETGQKPDVVVQLRQGDDAVRFGGPLEFVNKLSDLLPSNGFADPPAIEVTPSGIGASYFLNLPTVGVGVLSIANMSVGAGFQLPFDGTPASVRFGFSRRESPFSLTVMMFGGGGFFAAGISARGVTEIEAALEFGAGVAINLGVASGSVELKAGIYFHWLEPIPDKGSVELAGYVRLHGELSIISLISVSLTFNLQLAYLKDKGAATSIVWGEATLVVKVEVLFFSKSVSVRCERQFAGSESDPSFLEQMPTPDLWTEYCEAYALEEVA